jgi:hypothetical protein
MTKKRRVYISRVVGDQVMTSLLGYATSQEKLSRGEIDSFVIGLTRAKAAELGRALLERSGMDPAPREPKQTQH